MAQARIAVALTTAPKDCAREPVCAFIGIGANLGDASSAVNTAIRAIHALMGVQVQRVSSLYGSAPVDSTGPNYINAVLQLSTTMTAPALLAQLQSLELAAGRERPYRNAPRTLDLDLLLYGQSKIQSQALIVPHPRMLQRAFVLVPLAEIAPEMVTRSQLETVLDQVVERLQYTTPNHRS
jgi:2-amino-4-hydroxy-6-hydroxymethyldihydropteridine diphosphokinase